MSRPTINVETAIVPWLGGGQMEEKREHRPLLCRMSVLAPFAIVAVAVLLTCKVHRSGAFDDGSTVSS
jgi:hypothetical protein